MKRVLVFIALVGLFVPTAHAKMKLDLNDGLGNQVTLTDGDNDGVIVFNGVLGVWSLNVTTGVSKPFIGGVTNPKLDLNSVNATSLAGGVLTIMLTDTDFAPAPSWTSTKLSSAIGGTTNGTVWLDQVVDEGNAEFAQLGVAELSVSLGPLVGVPFSAAGVDLSPLVSGPFSVTEIAVIKHTGGGQITSFDAHSVVTPLPGAVLLGMLGLSAAGIKLRRYV